MTYFTQQELKAMAMSCAEKILNSEDNFHFFTEPYRHLVLDNFFDEKLVKLCLENFPSVNDSCWERSNDSDIEIKLRTSWKSEFDIPTGVDSVVRILNSSIFLNAVAKKIGIEKLIPDPYFTGGGLNVMLPGGLLDVHVDGNYHDATGLNRRLNAILYLNEKWEDGWNGEFGIYDQAGVVCMKKIAPIFNRLVIFDSHDYSFHGLPEPINCPEGDSRKSVILYYYTKESRPLEHVVVKEPHSALWVKRDLLDKRGQKTRLYE